MRNKVLSIIFLSFAIVLSAQQSLNDPKKFYIETYSELAMSEMSRTGVPASITLAQGILESASGRSQLAIQANNHFGIKCHNWQGERMYFDDDEKGECFRKYPSPEQSFIDHSDFLRYRDRYKFLFDLKPTDYKGWAHGLKKAGYATDPKYAQKLIDIIEEYNLNIYDSPKKLAEAQKKAGKTEYGKADSKKKKLESESDIELLVPDSPLSLEAPKPYEGKKRHVFSFSLSRKMFSQNGVPFVYANEGETYEQIAKSYNLFKKEILRFNDAKEDTQLHSGTVVYLQAKKNKAAKGLDKHVVEENESLRDISQRFGVKMSRLVKLNQLNSADDIRPGDLIKLRK